MALGEEKLTQNKFKEAETFRTSIFPRKLIKFISLGENEAENEKEFKTLEEKKIWISNVTTLNDPYEFKSLYLDEDKLKSLRFPENIIANLKKILDRNMKKIGISSLSQNSYDSLPMWAYYTNNYAGYCVVVCAISDGSRSCSTPRSGLRRVSSHITSIGVLLHDLLH